MRSTFRILFPVLFVVVLASSARADNITTVLQDEGVKSIADIANIAQAQTTSGTKWVSTALNQEVTFTGTVKFTDGTRRLAVLSDDGVNVTINGTSYLGRKGTPQHLPDTGASFKVLNIVLQQNVDYVITVEYKNVIYDTLHTDVDGVTLFAYDKQVVCEPLTTFTMGSGAFQIQVSLAQALDPLPQDAATDPGYRAGFCHYYSTGVASVMVNTVGGTNNPLQKQLTLQDVDIDCYRAIGSNKPVTDTTLKWVSEGNTDIALTSGGNLSFRLYSVALNLTSDADGSNLVISQGKLEAILNWDSGTRLYGPVFLTGELNCVIEYTWNAGSTNWGTGAWSFTGLGALGIEVRRPDGSVVASGMCGAPDANGVGAINLAVYNLNWQTGQFALSIGSGSASGTYNLSTAQIDLTQAHMSVSATGAAPITGSIQLSVDWQAQGQSFTATVDNNNSVIQAFGMQVPQLSLTAQFSDWELDTVSGSIWIKHADFAANFQVQNFVIDHGVLTTFQGSGELKCKNFTFTVSQMAYDAGPPKKLNISASITLGFSTGGNAAISVQNFCVSETGTLSIGQISADLNASPVSVHFDATFGTDRFTGNFSGQFPPSVSIAGTMLIGHTVPVPGDDGYTFGFFSLSVNIGSGIPLGSTGLKLTGLNGAFGFNYIPPGYTPPGGSASAGGEELGAYFIQAGITLADVLNLVSVHGDIAVALGQQTTVITVTGSMQVTASTNYFNGSLTCSYTVGSGSVSGSLAGSVNIPANGFALSIPQATGNSLAYAIGQPAGQWSISGSGLHGTFFSFLNVQGGISLSGTIAQPINSIAGNINATISGSSSASFAYPSNFSPYKDSNGNCVQLFTSSTVLDCQCADSTDNAAGFGFSGQYDLTFGGNVNANLDQYGVNGTFSVHADFSGGVGVKWPCFVYCGSSCAWSETLTASASLTGARSAGGTLHVWGSANFVDSAGNTSSADLDYTF